jgi:hypothetical protein
MSTAVILGAGASKGAWVAERVTPPLDAEFLAVAKSLPTFQKRPGSRALRTHYSVWSKFNDFLEKAGLAYEEVENWRLEQLSTFLEARATLRGLQLEQGRPVEFRAALEKLKGVVSSVLVQAGGGSSCRLHRRLFEVVDTSGVVSFNYDLIVDQTLAELGWLKWDAPAYRGASRMRAPKPGKRRIELIDVPRFGGKRHVPLFKIHGSINWERHSEQEHGHRLAGIVPTGLLERCLAAHFQPKVPLIIPPVAAKVEVPEELGTVWKGALRMLNCARRWIFWGYSFPQTDTISQVLFRSALNGKTNKPVVVINPDHAVVQRVKSVCRRVDISYFPSVERFLLEETRRQ